MRKHSKTTFVGLLALFLLFACTKENKHTQLHKKWIYSAPEMIKLVEADYAKKIAATQDSSQKQALQAAFESSKATYELMYNNSGFSFKEDGSYHQFGGLSSEDGKWKISDDGKTLSIEPLKGSGLSYSLEELSDTKLVLKNGEATLIFVPKP